MLTVRDLQVALLDCPISQSKYYRPMTLYWQGGYFSALGIIAHHHGIDIEGDYKSTLDFTYPATYKWLCENVSHLDYAIVAMTESANHNKLSGFDMICRLVDALEARHAIAA